MSTVKTIRNKPEKVDLYGVHKAEYVTPKAPVLLNVGKAQYLAIDGQGAPGGEAFTDAVGALMAVAFTAKMASKFGGRDYGVCKLEGQWWVDEPKLWASIPKDQWRWRMLIRTPDFITAKQVAAAADALIEKGKSILVRSVRLMTLDEGRCVQVLHTGPYDREHETIAAMEAFAKGEGCTFEGLHHEIYLSDPRRVAPAKLRTILRMPVRQ